jgi:hypothetical protein
MGTPNIRFTQLHVGSEVPDPDNHPQYICENCALLVSAECRNDGDRATRGFKVGFKIDDGPEQLESVEPLSPGESTWIFWRHDALQSGTHYVTVDFDATDRVREEDEFDNAHTEELWVWGAQADGHTVDFSGEGEEIVAGDMSWATEAGWRRADVGILLKNPLGGPLTGYQFMVEFISSDGEKTVGTPTVGDFAPDAAGLMNLPDVWLKPSGYVTITALPESPGPFEDSEFMTATGQYQLAADATAVTFHVRQRGDAVTLKAGSQRQAIEKATQQVGAKVSILKIVELNGGIGHEETESETSSNEMQYQVYRAFPVIEFVAS